MRLTIITGAIVTIQSAIIIGMYYMRANSLWPAAKSDLLAFYLPTIVAVASIALLSQIAQNSQAANRSIARSIVLGCFASAVGLIIGLAIGVNSWGG